MKNLLGILCVLIVTSCQSQLIDTSGTTVETRFKVPEGFVRVEAKANSYAKYLRSLPLKKHGSLVKHYDGTTKRNNNVYAAVVDLKIGKRDLHQCADAVMRLRAEHLWKQKKYSQIHFNFMNGFNADYNSWRAGKRIVVKGNKSHWVQSAKPSNNYATFWKYLEMVFAYAGSYSLSKELKTVKVAQMKIGDVFILGGTPGHTEIVVDMAVNYKTGEKIFLLAQSYMPAQETQILLNPKFGNRGCWYSANFGFTLETPEFTFYSDQLMRFDD
ncbi:MAG: hypothetical protein ACJAZ2_001565 [Glaciecola sp.]|jgi:hypothetical protein